MSISTLNLMKNTCLLGFRKKSWQYDTSHTAGLFTNGQTLLCPDLEEKENAKEIKEIPICFLKVLGKSPSKTKYLIFFSIEKYIETNGLIWEDPQFLNDILDAILGGWGTGCLVMVLRDSSLTGFRLPPATVLNSTPIFKEIILSAFLWQNLKNYICCF